MDISHFHFCTENIVKEYLSTREGETKIGETIYYGSDYHNTPARFILLGIEESIGVKGNLGVSGTHTAWDSFLKSFLNIQDTHKFKGDKIHLLGHFDFQALGSKASTSEDYRKIVHGIDVEVFPLIQSISATGKIPIIIGGSHANAFPIIKGISLAKKRPINVVNLDAHADFRALEGRHSGNPFSTAKAKGFMADYSILGLHENYNSQSMLDEMAKYTGIRYYFWEDIFLRGKISFHKALSDFIQMHQKSSCGIEFDLDSVEGVLSSAISPSGFTSREARYFAYQSAYNLNPLYLHLCEGAIELETGQKNYTTGKLLSYLVSDFVKGISEK